MTINSISSDSPVFRKRIPRNVIKGRADEVFQLCLKAIDIAHQNGQKPAEWKCSIEFRAAIFMQSICISNNLIPAQPWYRLLWRRAVNAWRDRFDSGWRDRFMLVNIPATLMGGPGEPCAVLFDNRKYIIASITLS